MATRKITTPVTVNLAPSKAQLAQDLENNGITGTAKAELVERISKYVTRLAVAAKRKVVNVADSIVEPAELRFVNIYMSRRGPDGTNLSTDWWVYGYNNQKPTRICETFGNEIVRMFPSVISGRVSAFKVYKALRQNHVLGEVAAHTASVLETYSLRERLQFAKNVSEMAPHIFGYGATVIAGANGAATLSIR